MNFSLKKLFWLLLVLVVLIIVLATGSVMIKNNSLPGQARLMEMSPLPARQEMSSDAVSVSKAAISLERKIAKNGRLSLLVEGAEQAAQAIQTIAEEAGGFVSSSNLYEVSEGVKAGAITIQVPAEKFSAAMDLIKQLAVKVERENVTAEDVTEQFVDLTARLTSLRAQEQQYLAILKKAQKIEDVMNVTNRLDDVRGQIESLQGQIKYLNSQVEMSAITVNLTAEKSIEIWGVTWRPLLIINQSVQALLNGLVNYANAIIAIVIYLPVVVVWIATVLLVSWLIWRIVVLIKTKKMSCPLACAIKKPAKKSSPKA